MYVFHIPSLAASWGGDGLILCSSLKLSSLVGVNPGREDEWPAWSRAAFWLWGAWCPSCGAPVRTEAHRGRWGQGWSHSPLLLAHPSHRRFLLVKILFGDLSMDLHVLWGKYKLCAVGLGAGVRPRSPRGTKHGALAPGTARWRERAPRRSEGWVRHKWTGEEQQLGPRAGAAALGNSPVPRGCCAADREPARGVRETAGTCSNTPSWGNPSSLCFSRAFKHS